MGGTSESKQTQVSSLAPYAPASGAMSGILGSISNLVPQAGALNATQSDALGKIISNSNNAPDYSKPINSGTLGLLNGGGATQYNGATLDNLAGYKTGLSSYTDPNYSTVNSPAVRSALDQIATDTTNSINGQWAAAGRDGSPGNAQALGRGIAQGEAPLILNQANQDTATRIGALNNQYGAGNTTYGILNGNQQNANTNFTNGVGTVSAGQQAQDFAPNAALAAASQYFGIPAAQLTTLLGSVSPVAAQFGTQTGTSQGSNTMSGAQQFALIANGIGSLWPKGNISFGGG